MNEDRQKVNKQVKCAVSEKITNLRGLKKKKQGKGIEYGRVLF